MASNSKVLLTIVKLTFEAKLWKVLNEQIVLFSKKHGLLKQAIVRMIQAVMEFVDKLPTEALKLELIDTIRTITEGKIYLEVERARVTKLLSKMKEDEGKVVEAADILQELQVETFGSMDRLEKTEFILEQMRLCLAKKDYTRVQIISKKITGRFFEDPAHADLKIRFYKLMIEHGLFHKNYLAVCKYCLQIYNTPKVQADKSLWPESLQNAVFFAILSPYDNEQSDLLHRIYADEKLSDIPIASDLAKSFITSELLRWSLFESKFKNFFKATFVFDEKTSESKARLQDLRARVVEHNVRVIAKCFVEIKNARLCELLELTAEETEKVLSKLVVSKTIYARINRPTGIIKFNPPKSPNEVLDDWSRNINSLLDKIQSTCHLIQKEEMVASSGLRV